MHPSVLLGQTKPKGFILRVVSDLTKHEGMVIVPIIKHLGRAVCLAQQNMTAILAGLFASPNKTWQPSWQGSCQTQQNMAAILAGLFCLTQQNMAAILAGLLPNPTKHGSHLGRAVCLTQQNMQEISVLLLQTMQLVNFWS